MPYPAMLGSELVKDTLVADGYIFGNGGAGSTDWRLWIGRQPTSPDRAITIFDATGLPPNPRWLLDYPSVQVKVRGGQNDYQKAGQKVREIRERLVGRPSYDAHVAHSDNTRDRVVQINGIGDIAFTGWDDADRPEFVINIALIIEPSPTTSYTNREPL